MSKIGDFFTWIFITLIVLWLGGMIFAGNTCTRVNRAAWPVTYSIGFFEFVSKNWTNDEDKLSILLFKAKASVNTQEFFEKTVYGETSKCKK